MSSILRIPGSGAKRTLAVAAAIAALVLLPSPAAALPTVQEKCHPGEAIAAAPLAAVARCRMLLEAASPASPAEDAPGMVVNSASQTYRFDNTGFGLTSAEPTEGGLMTRTAWIGLEFAEPLAAPRRIVLHTVGSSVNTVLAVYSGSRLSDLVRVAGNDDFAIPGGGARYSLVQFDAQPGRTYWVQVGSIDADEGEILLTASSFLQTGGLSVFLNEWYGNAFFGDSDYFCSTSPCPTPGFFVYNSTDAALDVGAATTLPARFYDTPAVSVPARSSAIVRILGIANTDFTSRTETGELAITARSAGRLVSRDFARAVVVIRGDAAAAATAVAVLPSGRAGRVNQPLTAFATVLNAGAVTAHDCLVRTEDFSGLLTSFRATDPATNQPIGGLNEPVDIPAGGAQSFVFSVQAQMPRLGDPTSAASPMKLVCANQPEQLINLANTFALTTVSGFTPADMISIGATPSGDGVVRVGPNGQAFAVATVNIGAEAEVTARAVYARPAADPAAEAFSLLICPTDRVTGACLSPPAAEVSFLARRDEVRTFTALVFRGAAAPAYAPGERRIVVEFRQAAPAGAFTSGETTISVGSTSAAASF